MPGAAKHLGDGGLEALVGVGDAQRDAVQAAGAQAAEELAPKCLGLGLADGQPDDLAAAAGVHAVGDHQRLVAHPACLAHSLDFGVQFGVQPQVGVGVLQRPLAEDADLLVQALAQPRHLAVAHVVDAELLDQPVDLAGGHAGGHAVDVGLLHHRHQGLLGTAARLQKRREVAAGPQPWDGQLDGADPGVPVAGAVAVAVGNPVGAAFAVVGAGKGAGLGFHQLVGHPGNALAQHVGVLVGHELVSKLGSGHPWPLGHRGVSFVDLGNRPTIMRHAVAEFT